MIWFVILFFFFKQKTAYEMRISDWSSDVCSSDLLDRRVVDIDPGRPCARARRNAADADLVLTGIELHARREARQILERFDPLLVHVRLAERADADGHARDRKSVVLGKSGSVRVDLGGSRIITKQKIMKQYAINKYL